MCRPAYAVPKRHISIWLLKTIKEELEEDFIDAAFEDVLEAEELKEVVEKNDNAKKVKVIIAKSKDGEDS